MDTDGAGLLVRAAAGDRDAFEGLVRRWERPLYRFLERTLGASHLAEEARQIVFVRVLERGAGFRGGSASSWIFRVAYRTAIDLRRREGLRRTSPLDDDAALADAAPGPAETAAALDERDAVRAALSELDMEDRALLWLRVADERTFADVAATLGIPESTARLRLVRALARLRRKLVRPEAADVGGERCGAMKS